MLLLIFISNNSNYLPQKPNNKAILSSKSDRFSDLVLYFNVEMPLLLLVGCMFSYYKTYLIHSAMQIRLKQNANVNGFLLYSAFLSPPRSTSSSSSSSSSSFEIFHVIYIVYSLLFFSQNNKNAPSHAHTHTHSMCSTYICVYQSLLTITLYLRSYSRYLRHCRL